LIFEETHLGKVNLNILFIGGGNMARAIISGLFATPEARETNKIVVIEPFSATATALKALHSVTIFESASAYLTAALPPADIVVLAVKPQMMQEALSPLKGRIRGVILSIAAGITTHAIANWLSDVSQPHLAVVRAMPNTPAMIHAGITGLYAAPGVDAQARQLATSLLATVGKTQWFEDEAMLDAVTAVSGSGPAYVFYFIEALEEAAVSLGFTPSQAREFALETFRGGALLAAQSADSPAILRAQVTSKRGTTEAAITQLDIRDVKAHIIAAVQAAQARSKELGAA
jgi:pyrroline-5-carboxylate reductase